MGGTSIYTDLTHKSAVTIKEYETGSARGLSSGRCWTQKRCASLLLTSAFPVPFIPFLVGLSCSDLSSLISDMLDLLGLVGLLPRCWNCTLRRDGAMTLSTKSFYFISIGRSPPTALATDSSKKSSVLSRFCDTRWGRPDEQISCVLKGDSLGLL